MENITVQFFGCSDDNFSIVKKIRNDVFEVEQGAVANEEFDEYDSSENTVYLLLFDSQEAIATGRIAITPKGFKIGRIAVSQKYRGKGIGKLLVDSLCEKAFLMGADKIFVDSQLHAVNFYKKSGFELISNDVLVDRGLKHLPMVRRHCCG